MDLAQALAMLQISILIFQIALFVVLLVIIKLVRKDISQKRVITPFPSSFEYTKETFTKGEPSSEKQNKNSDNINVDIVANGPNTTQANSKVSQSIYS